MGLFTFPYRPAQVSGSFQRTKLVVNTLAELAIPLHICREALHACLDMGRLTAKKDEIALHIDSLALAYREERLTPTGLVARLCDQMSGGGMDGVWIHRVPAGELSARARELESAKALGADLPLYGIPFAVKDNIDVAGMPTTAACPAFSHLPSRSAKVVERLLGAGALCLGKTNLDQFATGLVGTRTPYGIPSNPYGSRYIPGGSSSGSAVAVALGVVSFALGTDTAGSGRVPAAFNNIVGLKPSRGLIGTTGVVPACRSLDCVSIFANTAGDAGTVFSIAKHLDSEDPYARGEGDIPVARTHGTQRGIRFGVPKPGDLEFHGDQAYAGLFAAAVERLEQLGGEKIEVDLSPFQDVSALLYEGPWVAERLEAAGNLLATGPENLNAVVRKILEGAKSFDATDVYRALARLSLLRRTTEPVWKDIDFLVVPTAPTIYTVEQVDAEPMRLNSNLGRYTNFVNLLDLCGVAVPAGFRPDGLPFGITLLGPAGTDRKLLAHAATFHAGGTPNAVPTAAAYDDACESQTACVAVVGAHLMRGALNHQLTERGASLVATTRTAPRYRLFALPGTVPPKPGMVRAQGREGFAIEVEVWRMSHAAYGSFVAGIQAPLCIGSIELADGHWVQGFLCESCAVTDAKDISEYGGWRAYLRAH
jgi:allophanate hydrolase